jgi:hypothetical protein
VRRQAAPMVLWLVALVGCGAQEKVFEGSGVRFEYPADWRAIDEVTSRATLGEPLSRIVVGIDGANFVLVSTYRVTADITEGNVDDYVAQAVGEIGDAIREGGGRLTEEPTRIPLGELPAVRLRASGSNPDGVAVIDTIVVAFRGTTEYFVNCQHTPDHAEEIGKGCDRIVETFEVQGVQGE